MKPWEMNWEQGNTAIEPASATPAEPWNNNWQQAENPEIDVNAYNGTSLIGEPGEDAKPFEKMSLFMKKLFTFEVRDAAENRKNNPRIQTLEKLRREGFDDVKWGEVGKSAVRGFFEVGKGVTASPLKIYGDWAMDNRDTSLMTPREKAEVKRNNFHASLYKRLGEGIEKLWNLGLNAEWLKQDEEIFEGSFVENPSMTRALSLGASAAPSIGWLGGLAKLTGSTTLASVMLAGADADDIYFEAREAGASQNKALSLFAAGTAGTAAFDKYGFERMFSQKVTAPLAKRVVNSMLSEGVTEGTQTLWQNMVKKYGYDDSQELWEAVIESVIGGALSGGAVSAANAGYIRLQDVRGRLKEKGMTDNGLDQVQETLVQEMGFHREGLEPLFQTRIEQSLNKLDDFVKQSEETADAKKTQQIKADLDEVYNKVFERIKTSDTDKVAAAQAKVVQGVALWGSQELGISPLEYFEQRFPRIERVAYRDFARRLNEAKRAGEVAEINLYEALKNPAHLKGQKVKDTRQSLTQFLKQNGGLKDFGGELKAMDADKQVIGLINNKNGRNLDDMALAAWEAGYFPQNSERPTVNDLLDAIGEELGGRKRYNEEAPYSLEDEVNQLAEDLDRINIDWRNMEAPEIEMAVDAYMERQRAYNEEMGQEDIGSDELPWFQLPVQAYNKQGKADVNSEAFKRWFGDSKVVDESGQPLKMVHFSGNEFSQFDKNRTGINNDESAVGFWFADKDDFAFNNEYHPVRYDVYLKMDNPLIIEGKGTETNPWADTDIDNLDPYTKFEKMFNDLMYQDPQMWDERVSESLYGGFETQKIKLHFANLSEERKREVIKSIVDKLKTQGHDGIIIKNTQFDSVNPDEKINQYVVFEPNQIKSVYNRGTFDPNNDNIYYQGRIAENGHNVELTINSQEEMQGLSDEDFKNKMLDTLKSFKGNKIFNQSLNGDIEIRTSSIKKYKSFFADKNKRLIVPYIPELLGKAKFIREESYIKASEPNIKAYYKANLPINIDEDNYNAHLTVREDQYGNFFWDAQIKEEPQHATPATNPGDTGLTSELSEDGLSISQTSENVNNPLYQLPSTAYKNGKADVNSEAFKAWFGDSKVVDENGQPKTYWHGSLWNFDTFKQHNGDYNFSPDEKFAYEYAESKAFEQGIDRDVVTYPVYIKSEKPFDFDNTEDIEFVKKITDGKKIRVFGNEKTQEEFIDEIQGYYQDTPLREGEFEKITQDDFPKWYSKYNENINYNQSSVNEYKVLEVNEREGYFIAAKPPFRVDIDDVESEIKKKIKDIDFGKEEAAVEISYETPYGPRVGNAYVMKVYKPSVEHRKKGADNWIYLESAEIDGVDLIDILKENGYDGYYKVENGIKNLSVFSPNQIKSVYNRGTFDPSNDNIYYQLAFAGSRVDYDTPSLEAIGSGEGNQVHGWGLYYALNKDVAEGYRYKFITEDVGLTGDVITEIDRFGKERTKKIYKDKLNSYKNELDKFNKEHTAEEIKEDDYLYLEKSNLENSIQVTESLLENIDNYTKGQVHEVDIPENPYLLDEQELLSKQPPFVKKALKAAAKEIGVKWDSNHTNGKYIYDNIANVLGTKKAASQLLEKHGIKGITYDGNQDGRCFVIFNPADVKVIQKFYQDGADTLYRDPKGAFSQRIDRRAVISLFERADASTFMHETAHFFFEELKAFAPTSEKSAQMLKTVNDWLGSDGASYTVEQTEQFARGFEQYLREGKAPSSYLKRVFDAFMNWMRNLYKTAKELNVKLNDEVRGVYGEILGGSDLDRYMDAPVAEVLGQTKRYWKAKREAMDDIYKQNVDAKKASARLFKRGRETMQNVYTDMRNYLSDAIVPLEEEIKQISPELYNMNRRLEIDKLQKTSRYYKRIKGFVDGMQKMDAPDFYTFDLALKNRDVDTVQRLLEKYALTDGFAEVRNILDDLREQMIDVGVDVAYMPDYFPRKIKDADGLLDYVEQEFGGRPEYSIIQKMIEEKRKDGRIRTKEDEAQIVNSLIRGYAGGISIAKIGNVKERSIDVVDQYMNRFYKVSTDALTDYISGAVQMIENKKYFGRETKELQNLRKMVANRETTIADYKAMEPKEAKWKEIKTRNYKIGAVEAQIRNTYDKDVKAELQDRKTKLEAEVEFLRNRRAEQVKEIAINRMEVELAQVKKEVDELADSKIENSVGNLLLEMAEQGKISHTQELRLKELLLARFSNQGLGNEFLRLLRDGGYIWTLGNFESAITQFGDLGTSAYKNGLWNTAFEYVKAWQGKSEITINDLGLEKIIQDGGYADTSAWSRALDKVLKYTGFEKMDKIAKQTLVNSAVQKARADAKAESPELEAYLRHEFGEKWVDVKEDLKTGAITDEIMEYAMFQLLDVQPITIDQMPRYYAEGGKKRLFYMMKSYFIKQLNEYRKICFETAKSNPRKAVVDMTRLTVYLMLFNAGADVLKDLLFGRPVNVPDSLVDNIFIGGSINRYQAMSVKREGLFKTLQKQLLFPVMLDELVVDILSDKEVKNWETWKNVPWAGRPWYWWVGGGHLKTLKEEKKARNERRNQRRRRRDD